MRLIEIEKLEEDMRLGRSIYGENGQLLLAENTLLKKGLIEAIKKSVCGAIYIDDEISEGIEIHDVISEQLRREAIKKIKDFFTKIHSGLDTKMIAVFNNEISEILKQMVNQILEDESIVVNLIDFKTFDDYTYQHSVNVCILATVLGAEMNLKKCALKELAKSALFHDIGKMFIDKEIINKAGALTEEEFAQIRMHPQYGFDFTKNILGFSGEALIGIIHHHERFDGKGYPHSKERGSIHRNAQIISIVDVFDAITSKRVYHEAALPSEAIEYIMGNTGKHFSEEIVHIFLKKIAAYPVGMTVMLSNGLKGIVYKNSEGMAMRPKIKIITENPKEKKYIDLSLKEHNAVTIVGAIR